MTMPNIDDVILACVESLDPSRPVLDLRGGRVGPEERAASAVDVRKAFLALRRKEMIVATACHIAPAIGGIDRAGAVVAFLKERFPRATWTRSVVKREYERARARVAEALGIDSEPRSTHPRLECAAEIDDPEADPRIGVYIIRCDTTGRTKIGRSVDIATRIRAHAHTLEGRRFPGPSRVVGMIECDAGSVIALEGMLHWVYRDKRIGNFEIFLPDLNPLPESFKTFADVARAVSRSAA